MTQYITHLDAAESVEKWEDNERIHRRTSEFEFFFNFNGNYASSNRPFKIIPSDLKQIINRQNIKSYFDLGCGNGVITAAIGKLLGLNSANIFGGDIYEAQNKNITFIKMNESRSIIQLGQTNYFSRVIFLILFDVFIY